MLALSLTSKGCDTQRDFMYVCIYVCTYGFFLKQNHSTAENMLSFHAFHFSVNCTCNSPRLKQNKTRQEQQQKLRVSVSPSFNPYTHQLPNSVDFFFIENHIFFLFLLPPFELQAYPSFTPAWPSQASCSLPPRHMPPFPSTHQLSQPLLLCYMCPMSRHSAWGMLGAQLLLGEWMSETFSTPSTTLPNLCNLPQ